MTTEAIDIYERLADAIDASPHGFARTAFGVELKLIKMEFAELLVGFNTQFVKK